MSANVSSFVIARLVSDDILTAYWRIIKSSHPHLLLLPVVVPYSKPFSRISSPVSSKSSVTNGPSPTLVVYALHTPTADLIAQGPTPAPTHTPPEIGCDDVTYGYVP